jgi:hypothetical protein
MTPSENATEFDTNFHRVHKKRPAAASGAAKAQGREGPSRDRPSSGRQSSFGRELDPLKLDDTAFEEVANLPRAGVVAMPEEVNDSHPWRRCQPKVACLVITTKSKWMEN